MGGRVPKIMLDRATSSQQRWGECGEAREITQHDAGLHQDLLDLLLDRTKLYQTIERLISLSIISEEASTDGMIHYVCRRESARSSYEQNKARYIHQAFKLCCYVFPRKRSGDPS
jgi:hypothetical protein